MEDVKASEMNILSEIDSTVCAYNDAPIATLIDLTPSHLYENWNILNH